MSGSVTRRKLPNVYKSCPKLIPLEKWKILTSLQNLPKNVGDLGKKIVAKGFKKLPKIQKIAKSGHTDVWLNCWPSVTILAKLVTQCDLIWRNVWPSVTIFGEISDSVWPDLAKLVTQYDQFWRKFAALANFLSALPILKLVYSVLGKVCTYFGILYAIKQFLLL